MKKFLLKCLLFLLLIFSVLAIGLLIPAKTIKENLHYSIYDKHDKLRLKPSKKRIILLGGSNLSMGMHSPLIEKELNVEVINTAIHAGYGLKFMIDDLRPFVRENDVILLIPEYAHYFGNSFNGNRALIEILNVYPQGLKLVNFNQVRSTLKHIPKHSLVKSKTFALSFLKNYNIVDEYHRTAFNSNGDIQKHWGLKRRKFSSRSLKGEFNEEALNYTVDFFNEMKSKNVELYFSFPCLNQSSFNINKENIALLYKKIEASNIPIIGKPADYSFPDSLHFDTGYHLLKEGQFLRTNQLIKDLKLSQIDFMQVPSE